MMLRLHSVRNRIEIRAKAVSTMPDTISKVTTGLLRSVPGGGLLVPAF